MVKGMMLTKSGIFKYSGCKVCSVAGTCIELGCQTFATLCCQGKGLGSGDLLNESPACGLSMRSPTKKAPRIATQGLINFLKNGLLWQWSDQHNHLATFHLWKVLHATSFFGIFSNAFQQFPTQVLVGHFAATVTQCDLHLVAVFQEFVHIAHFHIVIIAVRIGTELNFFDFNDLLLLTGLSFFLLSLVFELTKIHDLADRRICVGRNLYQIKASICRHNHSAFRRHNARILAVRPDKADLC